AAQDDSLEWVGQIRAVQAWLRRQQVEVLGSRFLQRRGGKPRSAGDQLVEHDAQRVEGAAPIPVGPPALLPREARRLAEPRNREHVAHAKISDLQPIATVAGGPVALAL